MRRIAFLSTFAALIALLCAVAAPQLTAEGQPEPDPSFDPPWCGVGGTVDVRWEELEGASPYTVTVGRVGTVTTDAKRIELSCADIRSQFLEGVLLDHVQATLPLRVLDADGAETRRNSRILLLASAPQSEPPNAELIVGYTDLHVRLEPRGVKPRTSEDSVAAVAIFRYRAIGSAGWSYAMPFPPQPQSSRRYLPSHASDLEPDMEYEWQIAWVWHLGTPEERAHYVDWLNLDWWYSGLDWWKEQGADRWWRDWNAPEMIRWSDIERFRTSSGDLGPTVSATDDTIHMRWLAAEGDALVTATSPQWPGVIWWDVSNAYRWATSYGIVTSTMSGLPPDTQFDVQIAQRFWLDFTQPPPTTISVRTLSSPPNKLPGAADPNGIAVEAGLEQITVRWRQQEAAGTRLDWSVSTQAGGPFQRRSAWWSPARRVDDGRVEALIRRVRSQWTVRLYVNRTPPLYSTVPFMCAVWDIRTHSVNAETYLDRYFVNSENGKLGTVRTGQIPDDHSELLDYCRLGHPVGE